MKRPLKIIVGGYIVGYPLGGMTWHHLNYLLGLQELGHEIWFMEDSGSYAYPYNPALQYCDIDSAYGRRYLEETFQAYGLPLRYCYYSEFEDRYYGLTRDELFALLREADLLVAVSGVTPLREDRPRPRRCVVIDTDPVFTQLQLEWNQVLKSYYTGFDAAATFGRLIGTPACPLPTHGIDWVPTCQPVSLRHWPAEPPRSRRFTTIGKWEHSQRDVEFAGQRYLSSKGPEWIKLLDLPSRTSWTLELAMQSMPLDTAEQFRAHGWQLSNPEAATLSCRSYQQYIRESAGELTVAKQIYAGLPSGWFSDRSSAYLASGRPVITQASGFDQWLPTGEGLFSFATLDEAAAALEQVAADPTRHSAAARAIAEQHLDARKVLGELLDRVM